MARNQPAARPRQLAFDRAAILPFHLAGNRNAAHPVNAILNYAYTVLEGELRIKVIADGYDPTIGIMHEGRDGSSKFVFDLMEPERPRSIARCWISSRAMCLSRRISQSETMAW
jgi:CRISPR/Cas system-associated endonuclease Cas1